MTDSPLITAARQFATYAHASVGQTRKYTALPYVTHCEAVADLVRTVSHTEAMIAAAWLGDIILPVPSTARQ